MPLAPADPRVLEAWPAEFASLPFGSPEFKAANARLAQEDQDRCAPLARGMPTWINLTSTTVCNLKCFMCNQFLDPNSPREMMDEHVYQRVVRELYPYARTMQYGVKLEMVSNGTLMMKESKFREQMLRCLELVTFSMDGATRATYNSVRTGAEFDEVVHNISRFAERRLEMPPEQRPKMNFNFILMRRTVAEAPKFVEMVHRWGGDHIVFNHLVTFHPSLVGESLNYCRAYANEWQDRTREVAAALGVSIAIPPNFRDVSVPAAAAAPVAAVAGEAPVPAPTKPPPRPCGPPPIKCWFLWQRVYVAPFGEIVPCCLAGMPNFGSLQQTSFFDIWNGKTYRDYRQHVFTDKPLGKCKTCYLIYPNAELAGAEGFEY